MSTAAQLSMRTYRLAVDVRICAVSAAAVAVLQSLLFMGGWIAGQFAVEPARLFARDLRARAGRALDMEPVRPMIVRAPGVIPHAAIVAEEQPVRLEFAPLPPLMPQAVPSVAKRRRRDTPLTYAALIRETAARHDVPPALIEAVIRVESDFNPRTVSHKGARGLMQLMPATAARFGVRNPDHLFHPAPNLAAGTAYLAWLLKRYKGDLDLALAAYNAGEGAVDNHRGIPPYRETREYVRRVRSALSKMGA